MFVTEALLWKNLLFKDVAEVAGDLDCLWMLQRTTANMGLPTVPSQTQPPFENRYLNTRSSPAREALICMQERSNDGTKVSDTSRSLSEIGSR
jgi:hypothetical protein